MEYFYMAVWELLIKGSLQVLPSLLFTLLMYVMCPCNCKHCVFEYVTAAFLSDCQCDVSEGAGQMWMRTEYQHLYCCS